MSKVGRNESCPCGSGKKFKKCCSGKPRPITDRFTFDLIEQLDRNKEQVVQAQKEQDAVIIETIKQLFTEALDAKIACSRVERLLQWIEEQIQPIISTKPALFWICIDRRFPPALGISGDDWQILAKTEQRHELKTAIFHKYGANAALDFSRLPDGTFEFDVKDDELVHLFGFLFPYFDLLTSLPAAYRRLGKGATAKPSEIPLLVTELERSTESLTELYDLRRGQAQPLFLSPGGIGAFHTKELAMADEVEKYAWSTIGVFPRPLAARGASSGFPTSRAT